MTFFEGPVVSRQKLQKSEKGPRSQTSKCPILDYTGAPPKMIYSCIFGGPTIVCWCCCGDQPIVVFLLGISQKSIGSASEKVFAGILLDGHPKKHGQLL